MRASLALQEASLGCVRLTLPRCLRLYAAPVVVVAAGSQSAATLDTVAAAVAALRDQYEPPCSTSFQVFHTPLRLALEALEGQDQTQLHWLVALAELPAFPRCFRRLEETAAVAQTTQLVGLVEHLSAKALVPVVVAGQVA